MPSCFFASDLHGSARRYAALFRAIEEDRPSAVFLGGDLLPSGFGLAGDGDADGEDFARGFLRRGFGRLRDALGDAYPTVFLILGNDDPRCEEETFVEVAASGLWEYAHQRRIDWNGYAVYGYSYVPPTPFRLKDWERYDVSRYVDPGCLSPEEGWRTQPVDQSDLRYGTIQSDLDLLAGADDLSRAIFLFHCPPYKSPLDRAALDGRMVDYVPVDVHVGSIAIQRFIASRGPRVTLHGHVHESAALTGEWRAQLGETYAFSAAHDGPELALVRFDPEAPERARRDLI
ncbi:MAG: metallophosphoesterase family protein [Bacteroidales bacterium]